MRIGQQKQHVHFKTCLFRQAARALLLRKLQPAVVGGHFDPVAGFEFAEEELRSQRVQQVVLDGPLPLSTPGG